MGVSKNRGTPKWMVKIMENTIKMNDLRVFPLFLETPIWTLAVRQFFRDRKLGASLAFYTSNGRVLKLSGTSVASPGVMTLIDMHISVKYTSRIYI